MSFWLPKSFHLFNTIFLLAISPKVHAALPDHGLADTGSVARQLPEISTTLSVRSQGRYISGSPIALRVDLLNPEGFTDRTIWDATAQLSTSDGRAIQPATLPLYNGRGSASVTVEGGGDFDIIIKVGSLQSTVPVEDLSNLSRQRVSGTLSGAALNWSGVVQVVGNITITPDKTLTIAPGTLVLIDGNGTSHESISLTIRGNLRSEGTFEAPVVITATDPTNPWGRLYHEGSTDSIYTHTYITGGGASPKVSHANAGPALYLQSSTVEFHDCHIADLAGKVAWASHSDVMWHDCLFARAIMGPEHKLTGVLMEDTWSTEMRGNDDNDGLYFFEQPAGKSIEIRRGVIAAGDDDALDILGATITVEDYVIRDFADKGVSIDSGHVHMDRVFITHNDRGIAAKNPVWVNLNHTTITQNNLVGLLALYFYDRDDLTISWEVQNSIIWNTGTAIHTPQSLDETTVNYSTIQGGWPGVGNLDGNPLFVDSSLPDFALTPNSPAVNAGNPQSPFDVDDSIADQGAETTTDDDGDGYSEAWGDCDDENAAIHPGAHEIPGVDDDCDGFVDEGLTSTPTPDLTPTPKTQTPTELAMTPTAPMDTAAGNGSPTPSITNLPDNTPDWTPTAADSTAATVTPSESPNPSQPEETAPSPHHTTTPEDDKTPPAEGNTPTRPAPSPSPNPSPTDGEPEPGGCACHQSRASQTSAGAQWALLLCLLGLRRIHRRVRGDLKR